jgi:hypothetical protein
VRREVLSTKWLSRGDCNRRAKARTEISYIKSDRNEGIYKANSLMGLVPWYRTVGSKSDVIRTLFARFMVLSSG